MADCIHHWDLGASHKGIVHAKCRKCGAERDFSSIPATKSGTFGSRRKVAPLPITAASKAPD